MNNLRVDMGRYRHLALTVIDRAFQDIAADSCSSADRESAQAFLQGSPAMRHWCSVAGLDPYRVVDHARRLAYERHAASARFARPDGR